MRGDVHAQCISMREALTLNRDRSHREVSLGAHIENDSVCAYVQHSVVE
jgi:hypothetical protein